MDLSIRGSHAARRSRLLSRGLSSVALSLFVLAVGWSVLWLFARREAQRSLDEWLAAERAQSRIWTCPDRTIGGFPLGIDLRCRNPTFAEDNNTGFQGQLAGLQATAKLYFPTSVAIDLTGPLTIQDKGVDSGLTVNWAAARVTLRGDLPGTLNRGHLDASEVEITAAPGRVPTRIASATLGFQPLEPNQGAGLAFEAVNVRDPEADAVFGASDPVSAKLQATISHLPTRGASLATLLEQWRQAGGSLEVDHFGFAKGIFHAQGNGQLQVDDQHRVEGRLQTQFVGLEPLAARFGIPVAAVKLGGLLSGLLGGKTDRTDTGKSDLDLPIVIRDGRLYLGPAKTGLVLAPLY